MRLLIKGLSRSGTNYLVALIEKNFDHEVKWDTKHRFLCPECDKDRDELLMITKSPLAWLTSIHRQASRKPMEYSYFKSFPKFLRAPFRYPETGADMCFGNPVQAWNSMNQHWISAGAHKIRWESLLDPDDATNALDPIRGLHKSGVIELPENVRCSVEFDKNYYLKRDYLSEFSEHDRSFVEQQLDHALLKSLGYSCE